jgi:hypothetical protein
VIELNISPFSTNVLDLIGREDLCTPRRNGASRDFPAFPQHERGDRQWTTTTNPGRFT